MGKKPDPEMIDDDNPEWTDEMFARAMSFSDLPHSLQDTLSSRKRGPQKAPVKQQVTLRLSQDVLERFRATGSGWQTRIDVALKEWLARH